MELTCDRRHTQNAPASFCPPKCRHHSRSPPRARTRAAFSELEQNKRGCLSWATEGICPVAPRATPPPRPPRRATLRHRRAHPCPRLSGEVLARDAPAPEGALPVPGAAAFPDELSSPLGVLPMLGRPVPFSSWPLVLRRLPTSPHKPGPPGCARSTPSASQAGSSPRNKPGAGNVSTLRPPGASNRK